MSGLSKSALLGGIVCLGGCLGGPALDEKIAATERGLAAGSALIVDRTNDSIDGVCAVGGEPAGNCNLRAALAAAAGLPGPVEIELAVDSSIDLGDIAVVGDVDITTGEGGAITGAGTSRLFTVQPGATLRLRGVHVSGFAAYHGGAIASFGRLELDGAVFAQNRASCSAVGAMTAFATCAGGAIASSGELVLTGGTRFEDNAVVAEAYTASFTTATGSGGAIAASGSVLVDGPVVFAGNSASATAFSGYHPIPVGGAWATAVGGAIYSAGGSLVFSQRATGQCVFSGNRADASASSIIQPGVATSTGGAIHAQGQLVMAEGACSFEENHAGIEADLYSASPAIAPVGERFDAATQSIVLTPAGPVEWVDLHLRVDGGAATNVRMQAGADGTFVVGPLAVRAGAELAYSFTYFADGRGLDTPTFLRRVPLDFEPAALRPEVRGYVTEGAYLVRLVSDAPIAWADVHYQVNGGPQLNKRLRDVGGVPGEVLTLGPGDRLRYWMTYAVNGFVLETGVYEFQPALSAASLVWTHGFPGSDPALPDGCMPDGAWYTCEPYAFSRVETEGGFELAGGADMVPFEIIGTGPFGTSLVKVVRLAFDDLGDGTGRGVVQLPTSALTPGGPPVDDADRDRGKRVLPSWRLRATYMLGGEGLRIGLVDAHGMRSSFVDIATYRSSYCRYGCALDVPVAVLAEGSTVDLNQIRYVEVRTQGDAALEHDLVIGHILFDNFPN